MLNAATGGKQQAILFYKAVPAAKIEAGTIAAINSVGGLMVYFTAERQFIRDFLLEKPAEEPIVLIAKIVVLIYPVTPATIRRPLAKAFLHPNRKEHPSVACA